MLKGSMTVEMSFLMPLILLLIMSCILVGFYFHDKNIISGAAYETVVVESTKMRGEATVTETDVETLFHERVDGKCLLFSNLSSKAYIKKGEVQIEVIAKKKKFRLSVTKKAAVTEPEKKIRKVRRLKEIADGAKNYN